MHILTNNYQIIVENNRWISLVRQEIRKMNEISSILHKKH